MVALWLIITFVAVYGAAVLFCLQPAMGLCLQRLLAAPAPTSAAVAADAARRPQAAGRNCATSSSNLKAREGDGSFPDFAANFFWSSVATNVTGCSSVESRRSEPTGNYV